MRSGRTRILGLAMAVALVGLAGPLIPPAGAIGSGGFTAHPTTPSFGAGFSEDVALGDLDGDKDLDAVVVNFDNQLVTVWLNNGLGTFTAHATTPSFGGSLGRAVALGDLDGDQDLDAVVANDFGGAETVWLNNGLGTFTAHPTMPSFGGGFSRDVALADLDGDGDLDAVVANDSDAAETVWLNNGMGVFTAHPTTASFGAGFSRSVALADLDGDGDRDAVEANTSQEATVWRNSGAGSFTPHPTTPTLAIGSSTDVDVAIGDLDLDGDRDVVIANHAGLETVWKNNGSGVLTQHGSFSSAADTSTGVALADIDGDNDLDAVVTNMNGDAETAWLNNGTGGFIPHPSVPTFGAGFSQTVALGDLDGDGDPDAVVANGSGGNPEAETVWLNVNGSSGADTAKPLCFYFRYNTNPKMIEFFVRDTGTGLAKVEVTTSVNLKPVVIPPFTVGTTDTLQFFAIKDNQALSSQVAIVLTDANNNKSSCV
jgi:hypothetical protein